ncbi:MAG: transglutaminase domain-containing protein [Myxococcota bacterium]|nr:transglutaminase domain-containing protein [Myxococcota bacterium]
MNATALVAVALLASTLALPALAESPRVLRFVYDVEIGPLEGDGPAQVFVPLAPSDEHQRVISRKVDASIRGGEGREGAHGNLYWHGELAEAEGRKVRVRVEYLVERRPNRIAGVPRVSGEARLSPDEERRFKPYLDANALVPVNHPVLAPALEEIRARAPVDDKARTARATYDWVVDNVEYKKVGSGWGNGDTFWACSERYGNCTDFHSLFNSLARSSGIPARFEIGFPIPEDRGRGRIGGYHCWSQFYLPGVGWVPVDASEAFKHPERRDDFYGGQGADRIRFTTGRDLELGNRQKSGPLNYFIYPHVEVAGEAWSGPVEKTFSYEDVPAEEVTGG